MKRLLSLTLLLSFGTAGADDATLRAYVDASTALAGKIAAAQATVDRDALLGADVDALVATLADDARFLHEPPYAVDEMPPLMGLCDAATQAVVAFALFGAAAERAKHAATADPATWLLPLQARNVAAFQHHLGRLQPFQIRCSAREIAPMAAFLRSLPPEQVTDVRRGGVEQMRSGIAVLFESGLVMLRADSAIEADVKRALLDALAESASQLAAALPIATRERLARLTDQATETAPSELAPFLQKIRAALSDTTCADLCAF